MQRASRLTGRRPRPRIVRAALAALVLSLMTGCVMARYGPQLHEFGPATSPHGIQLELMIEYHPLPGELLEVMDSGVLVLARGRIYEVPWERITHAVVEDFEVNWPARRPPGERERTRLALVSRYPPGLTEEHRDRLLAAYGQEAPDSFPESPHGRDRPPGPDVRGSHSHHTEPEILEDPEVDHFLDHTRQALTRLRTREDAVLAGYRQLGPDFPGMGEHWINPPVLTRAGFDPLRPPVITFLETPSGPILTGAAFVLILGPGKAPPDFPYPGAWHDHSGTVDEETLVLNPAAALHASEDEPRIAMLHAWTGLDNPDGVFAQDNWAVPFRRLGLPVPPGAGPASGKALFLASGGDDYYETLIRILAPLAPDEERNVRRILRRERKRVDRLLDALGPEPTAAALEAVLPDLEQGWRDLWSGIQASVGEATWERVEVLGR